MKSPFRIPALPSRQTILVVGLLILLATAACRNAGATGLGLVQMVPSKANLIAEIKLGEALEDADLESLITASLGNLGGPETLDDLLEEASNELGMDLRNFSRILIFGDIAQNDDFFAVIAQGAFDVDTLIAFIEKTEGPLIASDYKGHILLIDESGGEVMALAVIDNETAVFGTEPAVKALIDVRTGDRKGASGPVYNAFSGLDDGLFRLALEIPQEELLRLEDSLGDSGLPFPISLDAITGLETVGILLDKKLGDIVMETTLTFSNNDSANRMADLLNGVVLLSKGIFTDEAGDILDRVEITVLVNQLTAKLVVSSSELEALIPGVK